MRLNNPFSSRLSEILLKDDALDDLVATAKQAVEQMLPADDLSPQILVAIVDPSGEHPYSLNFVQVAGGFNENKRPLIYDLGKQHDTNQELPLAMMLISEAWRASEKLNEDGSRKYAQPADDPDREEIITLQLLTIDHKTKLAFHATHRRADGKLQLFGGWQQVPDGTYEAHLLGEFYAGFFERARNRFHEAQSKARSQGQ